MFKTSISFTSGPWKIKPAFVHGYHNSDSIVGFDGKVVATTGQAWRRHRKERDANARLIAAAPELLHALELVEREMGKLSGKTFDEFSEQCKCATQSAILKARGVEVL